MESNYTVCTGCTPDQPLNDVKRKKIELISISRQDFVVVTVADDKSRHR